MRISHDKSIEFDMHQENLVNQISVINSIANFEGQGRDDLDSSVLRAANRILEKISPSESKSI